MTREQEITTMGAHAARTSETGPTATTTAAVRIATTTLAVAVTGIVGTGTALAHDDGSGQQGGHGHHEASTASADPSGLARAEAQRTVRDALADLGLPVSGTSDPDSRSHDGREAQEPTSDEHDSSDRSAGHEGDDVAAPAPPSSGTPRTSTQPITASPDATGAAELPPVGETRTVPIR